MNKNIFSLLLILVLFSCKNSNKEFTPVEKTSENELLLTQAQELNAAIQSDRLTRTKMPGWLKSQGYLELSPQNKVSISAALGGYLVSSNLIPGMQIKKGDIMAVLEDQAYIDLQEAYLSSKTKMNYLEAELYRQEELNKSKASSDKILQETKSHYLHQKIQITALSEKLKLAGLNPDDLNENNIFRRISLRAPVQGYVSSVNANIGKYLKPEDIIFELINPENLFLVLSVFEKDINQIYIGQKVKVFSNHQPDLKWDAVVQFIGKKLNQDKSATVHCKLRTENHNLLPGMFMNAEIEILNSEAYTISDEGLVRFDGKHYVFEKLAVLQYKMQEVELLHSTDGFSQIGFPESYNPSGKIFVVRGAYTLLMKLKNKDDE